MEFWRSVLRNYFVTGNTSFSVQFRSGLGLTTLKVTEISYVRQQFWEIIYNNKLGSHGPALGCVARCPPGLELSEADSSAILIVASPPIPIYHAASGS